MLTLKGPPVERGVTYGRLAANRIRDGLDYYRVVFAEAGLHGSRLEQASASLAEEIGGFDPDMLLELEGIASGAGVTLGEVISLNARSELMRMPDEGCTAIACLPNASDGDTSLAQNWDWHPSRVATGVLMRILPDDCPPMLTSQVGVLAVAGATHGLAVVGTPRRQGCAAPGGVPVALLRRRVLGCATLAEALHEVSEAPRGTSVNQ